ncbi:MAG: NAD(P)-dependent oxidoreductase [Anaerolineaceae bacterium]|nr:NAD(P)-dependent oxidoreductase [Anaerolineaceae bacterium]
MNVLLTGGLGDLGLMLTHALAKRGDNSVSMDILQPKYPQQGQFISGSILDREILKKSMQGIDFVIHIAAWHGIHLVTEQKNVYDFWDLNVNGTFNIFQAAADAGIQKMIYISSTSVLDRFGVYGHTKVLGEEIALTYQQRHNMDVINLRPSAFIPYWNEAVYPSFAEFAKWYWKGAVHIVDVVQSVIKSLDLLAKGKLESCLTLFVDGKYEYTPHDLQNWDADGAGSTFQKIYAPFSETASRFELDKTQKPDVFDIEPTRKWLGYEPTYSPLNLLQDLEAYGEKGPPLPEL